MGKKRKQYKVEAVRLIADEGRTLSMDVLGRN
jgi:hypothetical protein